MTLSISVVPFSSIDLSVRYVSTTWPGHYGCDPDVRGQHGTSIYHRRATGETLNRAGRDHENSVRVPWMSEGLKTWYVQKDKTILPKLYGVFTPGIVRGTQFDWEGLAERCRTLIWVTFTLYFIQVDQPTWMMSCSCVICSFWGGIARNNRRRKEKKKKPWCVCFYFCVQT